MKWAAFRRRRLVLAVPLALLPVALASAPAWAISGLNPLLPNAKSVNGQHLYDLYLYQITPFALLVFVLVEGLLLAIVIKFRRSRQAAGYKPPQWHGNARLEFAWTLGPILILIFIGWVSFQELQRDFVRPADAVTYMDIGITAHQYGWTYTYPEGFQVKSEGLNAQPMVIPEGKLVRLHLDSTDVIHSFWVPDLMGKTDAVPGYTNYTWIKTTQPGEWRGECAELCGAGHYSMQIRVKAVSDAEYQLWRNNEMLQAKAAGSPRPSPAASAGPSPASSPRPSPAAGVSSGPTAAPSPGR
jgi:cytochrome c oxidase subunit 2